MNRYTELQKHLGHELEIHYAGENDKTLVVECLDCRHGDDLIERVEKPVATLKIRRDEDCESPRETDDGNLGHMLCWHRRSNLGDEQLRGNFEPKEWITEQPKGSIILPLFLYEHGGMTLSAGEAFSDTWDSGQVGLIVTTPNRIRECFALKPDAEITPSIQKKAIESLKAEVAVYNEWLNGNCWGYIYTDENGEEDSCWGFIGSSLEDIDVPREAMHLLEQAWEKRWEE